MSRDRFPHYDGRRDMVPWLTRLLETVEEYDNGCYVHYGCPDVRGAKVCGYHLLCEGVEVGTVKPAHAEG